MKVMNIGIIIRNDHDDTFPVALTPQMVSIIQNLLTQIPAMQSKLVGADGKPVTAKASIPIIPRCMEFDWDAAYAPIMPEEEAKMMKALQEKYTALEAERAASPEATDEAKAGGIIVPEGMIKDEDDPDGKVTKLEKPGLMTDKDNPFNMELNAEGRANVDLEEGEAKAPLTTDEAKAANAGGTPLTKAVDQAKAEKAYEDEPDPSADDRVTIGSDKAAEEVKEEEEAKEIEEAAEKEEVKEMEDGIEKASEGECSGDCTVTPDALNLSGEQKSI